MIYIITFVLILIAYVAWELEHRRVVKLEAHIAKQFLQIETQKERIKELLKTLDNRPFQRSIEEDGDEF